MVKNVNDLLKFQCTFYISQFFQVSAIEAKVEHEAEFDNMEVITEKQENNKVEEINGDTNAGQLKTFLFDMIIWDFNHVQQRHFISLKYFSRESDPMVDSDKKTAPASILKQTNPNAGKRQRAPHIKQTVSDQNNQ